jgi:hypothetical protein
MITFWKTLLIGLLTLTMSAGPVLAYDLAQTMTAGQGARSNGANVCGYFGGPALGLSRWLSAPLRSWFPALTLSVAARFCQ